MVFKIKKKRTIIDGSMSNPYRSKSNQSFKQLTEQEKKQLETLNKIHKMKYKARILGDLRHISNEILSNCTYHEKNIEIQFRAFDRLNVPKEEKDLIRRLHTFKFNMGKGLLRDLEEFLNYAENEYNDKEKLLLTIDVKSNKKIYSNKKASDVLKDKIINDLDKL